MGLSFITEGAIPFAAPIRAGADILYPRLGGCRRVDALWSINVPAPHGDFVAALANHALLFLLAVLIGAVISGLLGLWKKPLERK